MPKRVCAILLTKLVLGGIVLSAAGPCEDEHDANECSSLAASGECAQNPSTMHRTCARSCGLCIPGTPHLPQMPILGLGTGRTSKERLKTTIRDFLRLGGRFIDTATIYGNHVLIGEVLREPRFSWLPRKDVFIVSKVWIEDFGKFRTYNALKRILRELQMTYVDLVLLHAPSRPELNIAAWKVLEGALENGTVHAIGVRNFGVEDLTRLATDGARITPMNNQISVHPGELQLDTLRYCQAHGISVTAYNSLRRNCGSAECDIGDNLRSIATRHHMTEVQVLLRWAIDHGIAVIPGATSYEHLKDALRSVHHSSLDAADLASLGSTVKMNAVSSSSSFISGSSITTTVQHIPNAHRWFNNTWQCISQCDEMPCDGNLSKRIDPLMAQYDASGFVVLQGLLPIEKVRLMASSVDSYIARRGPLLSNSSEVALSGYVVLSMHRDPELSHIFEWLHGSRRLHAALDRIFSRDRHHYGYQLLPRVELSIDRGLPWHQDGVPYYPYYGDQNSVGKTLLNVGLYLQDHADASESALVVEPGSHRSEPCQSALVRPKEYRLTTRMGDVIIFNFRLMHASGDESAERRNVEPTHSVQHRTLFSISYGPATAATRKAALAYTLRDTLLYDNATYGCQYTILSNCAYRVARQNWRRWLNSEKLA